jgi:hypothetical protein
VIDPESYFRLLDNVGKMVSCRTRSPDDTLDGSLVRRSGGMGVKIERVGDESCAKKKKTLEGIGEERSL